MKILVLGGTRSFGRLLVDRLVRDGHSVTVATRGNHPPSRQVEHVVIDRTDHNTMYNAFGRSTWDVVYDQVCYGPDSAAIAVDLFDGRIGKYILASSIAVYPSGRQWTEIGFRPQGSDLRAEESAVASYSMGKRLAEAWFAQRARFSSLAIRFPFVLGHSYAGSMLDRAIWQIQHAERVFVECGAALTSIISAEEASNFLLWQCDKDFSGAMNACSPEEISIEELVQQLSGVSLPAAKIQEVPSDQPRTGYDVHTAWEMKCALLPYSIADDWSMSAETAAANGYRFDSIWSWLPALAAEIKGSSEHRPLVHGRS